MMMVSSSSVFVNRLPAQCSLTPQGQETLRARRGVKRRVHRHGDARGDGQGQNRTADTRIFSPPKSAFSVTQDHRIQALS